MDKKTKIRQAILNNVTNGFGFRDGLTNPITIIYGFDIEECLPHGIYRETDYIPRRRSPSSQDQELHDLHLQLHLAGMEIRAYKNEGREEEATSMALQIPEIVRRLKMAVN